MARTDSAEAAPRSSPHGVAATGKTGKGVGEPARPGSGDQHQIVPQGTKAEREIRDGKRRVIARRHFQQGKVWFFRRQYSKAIDAFLKAYEYWDHPAVLYNLASAYALLEDSMRSRVYLRLYLRHTKKDPRSLPRVLKTVMEETAVLTVRIREAPPGAAVFVDGREAGQNKVDLVLRPGRRVVEVRLGDHVLRRRVVTLSPGGDKTWEIEKVDPPPPPAPPIQDTPDRPPRPLQRLHWSYLAAAGGATLALFVVATGTSVANQKIHQDFRREPWNDTLASRGRSMQAAANAFWGLSACALAGTAVLAYFIRWKRPESPVASRVEPLVGPGAFHLRLTW